MRIRTACQIGALIAFCVASASIAQTVFTTRTKPLGNEISAIAAGHKCRDFIELLQLPAEDWTKSQARLSRSYLNKEERVWYLSTAKFGIKVDARTGAILTFSNLGRDADRYLGRGRTGHIAFTSAQARARVNEMANRLGITPGQTLHRFSYETDATAKAKKLSAGHFGASFIKNDQIIAVMSFDIQDGVPLHIQLK